MARFPIHHPVCLTTQFLFLNVKMVPQRICSTMMNNKTNKNMKQTFQRWTMSFFVKNQESSSTLGDKNIAVPGVSKSTSSSSSSSSCCSRCSSRSSSSSSSSSSSEDCEDIINDHNYVPKSDEESEECDKENHDDGNNEPNQTLSANQDIPILVTPPKKGKKRQRNTKNWKRNLTKKK
ncbi:putative uncharacterized protein DDB_G0281733 [Diabrotica virgifera virgifera]|uniref:Suppressor protein SRP40-like n=1 Tax=Diabrotica virgifera virgifera TaxID=50390 RepID=A0ABM5L4X2_DIAVI|nr:putative uncharacterized protein DDB_G0281733 [Diabrotica virgifera virgifera]